MTNVPSPMAIHVYTSFHLRDGFNSGGVRSETGKNSMNLLLGNDVFFTSFLNECNVGNNLMFPVHNSIFWGQ